MWLVPIEDLSADQAAAVAQDTSRNRIVVGGPGSGKTLVLAHRAQSMVEQRKLSRDRVRLLVYTNVLSAYISEGLADLRMEDICSTFDFWVRSELTRLGLPVPRGGQDRHEKARQRLRAHLEAASSTPYWDALLVDEGQDLDSDALRILRLSARHVTLAMDDRQQLYDTDTDIAAACRALGVRRASAQLLSAYRCTPNIVRIAAEYLPTGEARRQFRESNLMPISQRELPIISTFQNAEEELDALAEALRERAFANQSSAVLLADNWRLKSAIAGLQRRGLAVRTRKDPSAGPEAPIALTYHSAKGLTVGSVFLPRLTSSAFKPYDPELVRRLLFVGITRATHWLWLGTVVPRPVYLEPITAFAREGVLIDGDLVPSRKVAAPSLVADDHDDLMDLL